MQNSPKQLDFSPWAETSSHTKTRHRAQPTASNVGDHAPPGSGASCFSAAVTSPPQETTQCYSDRVCTAVDISYAIFLKYCLFPADTEIGSRPAIWDLIMP